MASAFASYIVLTTSLLSDTYQPVSIVKWFNDEIYWCFVMASFAKFCNKLLFWCIYNKSSSRRHYLAATIVNQQKFSSIIQLFQHVLHPRVIKWAGECPLLVLRFSFFNCDMRQQSIMLYHCLLILVWIERREGEREKEQQCSIHNSPDSCLLKYPTQSASRTFHAGERTTVQVTSRFI